MCTTVGSRQSAVDSLSRQSQSAVSVDSLSRQSQSAVSGGSLRRQSQAAVLGGSLSPAVRVGATSTWVATRGRSPATEVRRSDGSGGSGGLVYSRCRMTSRTSVLCPVDFSDASRGALRYATVVANHLKAELVILTVTDPLLTEAAEMSAAVEHLPEAVSNELRRFCERSFEGAVTPEAVRFEVATGKPAVEILRVAKEQPTSLVVMSTHGLTGVRKLFFGSTTERVLRETTVPVLLTPAHDHGPARPEDVKRAVKRLLVPVDFSPATLAQVLVGQGGSRRPRRPGPAGPRRRAGALRGVGPSPPAEYRSRAAMRAQRSHSLNWLVVCRRTCGLMRWSPTEILRRRSRRSRGIATPASS